MSFAFVKQDDLNRLLGMGHVVHEIAVLTENQVDEEEIVSRYNSEINSDLAQTWKETDETR